MPAIISAAGERASFRLVEFFTANIRNQNTRVSYGRALWDFCDWCEERGFRLEDLNPVLVAGYVELLDRERGYSKPSVKQHLAAIRMLFDYLVTGGVIRMNPASSVRGPRYSIKRGKTLCSLPRKHGNFSTQSKLIPSLASAIGPSSA